MIVIDAQIRFWLRVAADLGIEIVSPFEAVLPDGSRISATALVRSFGAERGMVIVADFADIKSHTDALRKGGYGYSADLGRSPDRYDRELMIEVLADWGWTGDPAKKPSRLP
jgi:hypothetical protein